MPSGVHSNGSPGRTSPKRVVFPTEMLKNLNIWSYLYLWYIRTWYHPYRRVIYQIKKDKKWPWTRSLFTTFWRVHEVRMGRCAQTTEVQDEKSEDHIETMQRLNVTVNHGVYSWVHGSWSNPTKVWLFKWFLHGHFKSEESPNIKRIGYWFILPSFRLQRFEKAGNPLAQPLLWDPNLCFNPPGTISLRVPYGWDWLTDLIWKKPT